MLRLLTLCLAFGVLARGQVQEGELRLSVTDPSRLPLRASVHLMSSGLHAARELETQSDGRLTIQHLHYGVYRLQVEHAGFSAYTALVSVHSAVPESIGVQLLLAEASTTVDVSDKATLLTPEEAGDRNLIGGQQLKDEVAAQPNRGILELVNRQPGWLFEANGVLHPRGSEYQTQFVVDGMPMEENRSPAFAPGLQTNDVTGMAVFTGGYPAEYGRKLGGVIEVSTAHDLQSGFHGSAELGGGSFSGETASVAVTYGWSKTAVTVEASGERSDRYLDPPVLGNFTNTGSSERFAVTVDENVTDRDRLHFAVDRSAARFDVPNENLQQAAGQRQDRDTPELEGQFAWDHVFSANVLGAVRSYVEDLSANLWSNSHSTPVIASQSRGFRRSYLSASLSVHKGAHDLKFGGDAFYAPVTEALQYRITDPSFFDDGTPLQFSFLDHRLDREQALYAEDSYHFRRLTLNAGVRFDHYSFAVKDHAVSPRFGAAYDLAKFGLVLRASYDRVFQTPATENLLLASSPQVDTLNASVLRLPVRPSRGDFYGAGFSKALGGKLRLDGSVFRRQFANYADDDVFLNTGIGFPIAFRRAQVHGFEFKLDVPKWGRWSGFASYSNLAGIAETPVTGGLFLGQDTSGVLLPSNFPITQDQRNTVRAHLRYDVTARFSLALASEYGSGLPVEVSSADSAALAQQYGSAIVDRVNFARGRVRPNFSLDLSAGAELWRHERSELRAVVEADNVTDRLNVIDFAGLFSGTAIAPGRSATARLQFQF